MRREIKLSGVTEAAAAAGVSRQHVYLCCHGERKPSARLAAIIAQMVKPRPAPGKAAPPARR